MMEKIVRLMLRLPGTLHERIKVRAERERRSLNAELVHLLEVAMAAAGE
jgi:predicted HicB family RNase H-like nuclease